ncbi:MAG TPA: 6-phosphofructokinase, partial [Chryseosolibacter sp.]
GATAIVMPEEKMTFEQLYSMLGADKETSKKSNLIVVAEGSKIGDANSLARKVAERSSYFDIKVTILGHLQRGGAPTYFDRVLASRMGIAAVEGLIAGKKDAMVGIKDNRIVYNDFNIIMGEKYHEIDPEAIRIARILSI